MMFLSLLDISEHHNLKKKYKHSVYVHTGKPVKLATLVSQAPVRVGHTFTEPANVCDIIHGHYTVTGHLFVLYLGHTFTEPANVCDTIHGHYTITGHLSVVYLGHTFPSSAIYKFNISVMADMKNCKCSQMLQRNLLSPLSGFLNKPVQGLFFFPNEAGSTFLWNNTLHGIMIVISVLTTIR
jgi:hypothetical protein